MTKSRKLKPLLKGAVSLVMASSGVTAGCGDVGPGIEGDPGFVSTSCDQHAQDLLNGLRPEPEPDYLELRALDPGGNFDTVARVGEACESADDQAACLSSLEAVPQTDGFRLGTCGQVGCFQHSLITTQGDIVRIVRSKEEVAGLLGTIDTPEEAILLVELEGVDVRCGDGGAKPEGTGFAVQAFSYEGCDGVNRHLFNVASDGTVSERKKDVLEEADPNCVVGRRPAGLGAPARCHTARPLARYLAESARLEAASVHAFRQIERELLAHGAPRRLRLAARRAAADEVRHARVTAGLARRFGATRLEPPQVATTELRNLETLLIDNAIEGCVRETFGAAVGVWQAKHARDPRVAKAMRQIAADELRHATLAWEIAAWFEPKLDEAARLRVRQARRAAIAELRGELARPIDASLEQDLGVPSAQSALRLHRELERTVWS